MKTAIQTIIMVFLLFPVFGQDRNPHLDDVTFYRDLKRPLSIYYEDLLPQMTEEQENAINTYASDFIEYVDDRREIRNMIELYLSFGVEPDSVFLQNDINEITTRYLNGLSSKNHLDFDSNLIYIEALQKKLESSTTRIPSLNQLWVLDNKWQHRDEQKLYNYEHTQQYYIEDIAFDVSCIEFDRTNSYRSRPYLDSNYRNYIISQIEYIPDPYWRYKNYILFLENLTGHYLSEDAVAIATIISGAIIQEDVIDDSFKIDALLAITKVVTSIEEPLCHSLIMTNYGRLLALAKNNYPQKSKFVERLQVQMLNKLAFDYPRKSRFVFEADELLDQFDSEREKSVYTEEEYLFDNLLRAELLVAELKSHLDNDVYFLQGIEHVDILARWRLTNTVYEFEKFEQKYGNLPRFFHDRLFTTLVRYHSIYRNKEALLNTLLKALKEQKANAETIDYAIASIPDLLISLGYPNESNLWAKSLHGYALEYLILGEQSNNNSIYDEVSGYLFRSPSQFIEGDEEYWLSNNSDSITDTYIDLINNWNQVPVELKRVIKSESRYYFEFESFFVKNEQYKKAYVFGLVGKLARGSEDDTEIFSDMITKRNDAYSETRNKILEKKNSQLHVQSQRLSQQVSFLDQLVSEKQIAINIKNEEIAQKDTQLKERDSLLSSLENQIVKKELEFNTLEVQNQDLQNKKDELIKDNKRIEKKYGTLDEQRKLLESSHQFKNVLLTILVVFLVALVISLIYANNNRIKAQQSALLLLIEKQKVEHEKNIAEGLKQSINQIGHLCEKGITNIINHFFRFTADEKIVSGRQLLGNLSSTFRTFRNNRNQITNTIENEVSFAIDLLFSQKPQFCVGKSKDDLLSMIEFEMVKYEIVPIYTVVNVISNFFKHTVLDDNNRLVISATTEDGYRVIFLRCYAEIDPKSGETQEGTDYCSFMIRTVYGGDENVFKHYPIGSHEYHNIMKLKQAS